MLGRGRGRERGDHWEPPSAWLQPILDSGEALLWRFHPSLRWLVYGSGCLLALAAAFAVGVLAATPGRAPQQPADPAAAAPAASPAPAATAGPTVKGADARLAALRTEVEMQTSIVAALRNQADDARRELASLNHGLARSPGQTACAPQPDQAAPAGAADMTAGTAAPTRVVLRGATHLRVAPGLHGAIRRTLTTGAPLVVFARRDGWIQVGDSAPWGWVDETLATPVP